MVHSPLDVTLLVLVGHGVDADECAAGRPQDAKESKEIKAHSRAAGSQERSRGVSQIN
jgi:hypothetical protein